MKNLILLVVFAFPLFSYAQVNQNEILSGCESGYKNAAQWEDAGCPLIKEGAPEIKIDLFYDVVADWGINADGTTDWTSTLNNHLKDITDNKPNAIIMVYFPPGTYYFGETINIPSNVILKGAGSEGTNQTRLTFYAPGVDISVDGKSKVGLEDFKMDRQGYTIALFPLPPHYTDNGTDSKSASIEFLNSSNCWVRGVRSEMTHYAHVAIHDDSHHITVSGCYFRDAWEHRGGQGYGIMIGGNVDTKLSPHHCLIENNIFRYCRHSVVFQVNPSYNVAGYNFSTDEYSESCVLPGLDNNCLADFAFHGRFNDDIGGPSSNLLEGNHMQWIIFDMAHKSNGPYNVLFRNYSETGVTFSYREGSETALEAQFTQAIVGLRGGLHFSLANYAVPTDPLVIETKLGVNGCTSYMDFHGYSYSDLPLSVISLYKQSQPVFMSGHGWPYNFNNDLPAENRFNNQDNKTVYQGWEGFYCTQYSARNFFLDNPYITGRNFVAYDTINVKNYIVNNGSKAAMKAGREINLGKGFEVVTGGAFHAYIGDCTDPVQRKINTMPHEPLKEESKLNSTLNESQGILIFPNPNIGSFTIKGAVNQFIITNTLGQQVYQCKNREGATKLEVNLSDQNLPAGVYIITGSTLEGSNFQNKIIINK